MTDKQWQKQMNLAVKYLAIYRHHLELAETEYVRRFGVHPSEWDDDHWIDSFHQSPAGSTVQAVTAQATRTKDYQTERGRHFEYLDDSSDETTL